jgi:hypothetical protein
MAEFVGPDTLPPDMRLRVRRELHGKSWWLDLIVPESQWGELYEKLPGVPPDGARDAYQRSRPFWDWLAERNADDLSQQASPDAATRRVEWEVDNLKWLLSRYEAFEKLPAKS